MESLKHFKNCEANLCTDEEAHTDNQDWKDNLPWYPGEAVCGKKPFTKWQKRQAKINRWLESGKLKYPDYFFTVKTLLKGQKMYPGRKGQDPDK